MITSWVDQRLTQLCRQCLLRRLPLQHRRRLCPMRFPRRRCPSTVSFLLTCAAVVETHTKLLRFNSASRLLALPDDTKIWTGHDYPPAAEGRTEPLPYCTVAEQKQNNKHFKTGTTEDSFVQWRNERDASLGEPKLLHHALQFNIRAGHLPTPAGTPNGDRLLHVPLKVEGGKVF